MSDVPILGNGIRRQVAFSFCEMSRVAIRLVCILPGFFVTFGGIIESLAVLRSLHCDISTKKKVKEEHCARNVWSRSIPDIPEDVHLSQFPFSTEQVEEATQKIGEISMKVESISILLLPIAMLEFDTPLSVAFIKDISFRHKLDQWYPS